LTGGSNLSARVVSYDKTVERCGPIGRALASFANHRSFWTGSLARAAAADKIISIALTIAIALTDRAGVDPGVSAEPTDIAASQSAWIKNRTFGVSRACLGTAFATATFVSRQTLGHGLNADAIDTGVENARIVLLAAAISVVHAGCHANAMLAKLAVIACATTVVLRSSRAHPWDEEHSCRQSGPHKPTSTVVRRQSSSKRIYPLVVHYFPLAGNDRLSLGKRKL
jgi:hypothetical protein